MSKATVASIVAASFAVAWAAAGQTAQPLVNTSASAARVIVPDGSSLLQTGITGPGDTRWFVFGVEPGKSYVVEVVDPYADLASNTIGAIGVFDSNGITTPPPETNVDCTANQRAPALEVAADGKRCIVRAFPPTAGNAQNKRGVFVSVGSVSGTQYQIRVRESTIYGRWTTNGYNFHVEMENTTADSVCAEIVFYPNAGDTFSGTWSGAVLQQPPVIIPPFGANKIILASGTAVGADLRGTVRIGSCGGTANLVPGALHVSTYAFNPGNQQYLYFFTNTANNGATSNSW